MSLFARAAPSATSAPRGVGALAARAFARLPQGKTLPPEVWRERHRFMLGVIWLHVAGFAIAGVYLRQSFDTLSFEIAPIVACATAAALPTGGRRLRDRWSRSPRSTARPRS